MKSIHRPLLTVEVPGGAVAELSPDPWKVLRRRLVSNYPSHNYLFALNSLVVPS